MQEKVDLVVFVDRSEVMEGQQENLAAGLNRFIAEQKRIYRNVDAKFTFVWANHSGWVFHDQVPLRDVPDFTDVPISYGTNVPAVVYDTLQRFPPDWNVVVFIATGSTDSSQTKPALATYIKEQQSKSWSFFLAGIGKDAFELNESIFGLPISSVVSVPRTTDGFISLAETLTSFSNRYFQRFFKHG